MRFDYIRNVMGVLWLYQIRRPFGHQTCRKLFPIRKLSQITHTVRMLVGLTLCHKTGRFFFYLRLLCFMIFFGWADFSVISGCLVARFETKSHLVSYAIYSLIVDIFFVFVVVLSTHGHCVCEYARVYSFPRLMHWILLLSALHISSRSLKFVNFDFTFV